MTIGSLFSGVGGFELGFESTGQFQTIWQSEGRLKYMGLHERAMIKKYNFTFWDWGIPHFDIGCE